MEHTIFAIAAVGLAGIACQWLAWWLKLPAILLLLLAGILAGPVSGLLDADALFGPLLFPFISLGVAVVLFEGSLTLKLHEIAGNGMVVRNLVTVGALVNGLIIALATERLLHFPLLLALLFGAMVTVTGPTVITPLLRTMRPTADIARILRWEGIIIDPLGALLAVLVFEFIVSGQQQDTLFTFALIMIAGGGLGALFGWLLGLLLRHHLLPEYLVNVTTLALVLALFACANQLQHESGLLAVTVMGIWLANMRDVPIRGVLDFKESLSVMVISALFILLAARVRFDQFAALGWEVIGLLAVLLLVARPVAVLLATIGSKLGWRERVLLGWVAPRGIVAAAVAALFALRLQSLGFPEAQLLVPLTFLVIITTVVLQSFTARPLADLLGVSEPEPKGVLIVGANVVARALGKALTARGFRVMLTGTAWEDIREARMQGLPTYYGNAVSEHADRNLELVGIGRLFAVSKRPALNALACVRFRHEFGAGHIFSVQTSQEKGAAEKQAIAPELSCARLFGDNVSYAMLASELSRGGELHATTLSENFDFHAFLSRYQNRAIPLFAVDRKEGLRVFTASGAPTPEPGWTLVSLIPGELLQKARDEAAAAE